MLKPQIQDWIWGFLAGIVLTFLVLAATFRYLLLPTEMLGDAAAECRQQATIYKQEESKAGESRAEEHATGLQRVQSNNLKNDPDAQKHEYDCLIAKYTGNLAVFTRWLVAATAILALFGLWQVMISRDTARRQLRADVFAVSVKIDFIIGKEVVANLRVKNTGQTPAYDVIIETGLEFRLLPANSPISVVKPEEMSRMALGPEQEVLPTAYSGKFLTADESAAVADDRAVIIVYGQIKYRDAFKTNQTTDFRFLFDRTCALVGKGSMRIAGSGNKAT